MRTNCGKLGFYLGGCASAPFVLMASPSIAQTAPQAAPQTSPATHTAPNSDATNGYAKDDIIVTAQKRRERAQDVAASIAVVTGDSLQKSGAVTYADYLNSIPSVSYTKNTGFKDKIFIRGLSDTMSSRVLSTTGLYLDETPITEVDASLGDLGTFDVNRVEVLRGPQGTLFGSGSMGGTVRIITNKPKLDKFEAMVTGQVSGTYNGGANYETNAMLNIPLLTDKLGLRVVGGYRDDSGFINNDFGNRKRINSSYAAYVRGFLDIQPTSNLDILLGVNYQKAQGHYGPIQDIGLGKYNLYRLYPELNKFTTRIYTATINYTLPFATLTSATSLIDKDNFSSRDFTNSDLPDYSATVGMTFPNQGLGFLYYYPNKTFTQEVRLASTSSGPFHWLIGGYYNNFHPHNLQTYDTTVPSLKNYNYATYSILTYRRELAEFGELSFDVTSKFQLTTGIRHSNFQIGQQETDSGTSVGPTPYVAPWQRISQQATVLKFRADYKITPDNLLYAVASQGYRPGGPVSNFMPSCLTQLQQLGYSSPPKDYSPDKLWNFEVGSKNQFFDRKLTLNVDGYYIKWRNTQVAQNLMCGNQFISNAGGATTKGVELEVQAHPVEAIDLSFGGGYTDATFDTTDPTIRTIKGAQLPNVPKWTFNTSAQYNWKMGGDLNGFIHGDLQYVDGRYNDLPLSSARVYEGAYTTVNARIGITSGPWEVDVFARNLTNEIAVLNTTNTSGLNYQTINQPRTIGVGFRRAF